MSAASDRFTRELQQEFDGLQKTFKRVVSAAAMQGLRVAVMATPVDTGTLRNNWQLGTELPVEGSDTGERGGRAGAPPSVAQAVRAQEVLRRAAGTAGKLFLFNPMKYASFVENGEGPGTRLPKPMAAPAKVAADAVLAANRELVANRVGVIDALLGGAE